VVERDDVRDGSDLEPGDVLLGLASSGLHSNGHSLARKVLLEVRGLSLDARPAELGGASVADELLSPTRIYVRALADLANHGVRWKAAAHITGGGLIENPPRILRDDSLSIELRVGSWTEPRIFSLIAAAGVDLDEMRRTFNLGLGMIVAVAAETAERALVALESAGETATIVGRIAPRAGRAPIVFV
jgi:phosphoribosylformylglycinamidine cyclo-ligase